jgi:hypothetical protein
MKTAWLAALILVAAPMSGEAQIRADHAFAIDATIGRVGFSAADESDDGVGAAAGAELRIAPTWYVRMQVEAWRVGQLTLGIARAFERGRNRLAYLTAEGGIGVLNLPWQDRLRASVYLGVGVQLPVSGESAAFVVRARGYGTDNGFGVALTAGVKWHAW